MKTNNNNLNTKSFKTVSFILSFIREHKVRTILLAFTILGSALSGLLPSFTLKFMIDSYITPSLSGVIVLETSQLILLSLAYFSSFLLVGLFTVFQNYMIDDFGQKLIHALRYQMIEKSHRLKSGYFTHHGSGEMTSKVTDDVYAIEMLFAEGLVSMVVNLFKIVGILVSVFVFSWALGLILLALIPIIFFITQFFRKRMLKNQLANRKILNQETNNLSETIDSSFTVQNLSKQDYREKQFQGLLDKGYVALDRTGFFDSIYSPIIEMIKAVTISAVTILVCYSTDSLDNIIGISIGTFAAALSLISNVFSPIEEIGQELQSMQEGASGIKRVESYMNEPEICEKNEEFTSEYVLSKTSSSLLSFNDLTFHYEDGEELIFNHMNLEVNRLDKISLVGRTGVGKTTLFRLILGILEPTEGNITVNGIDVTKIPDREKRKIFGYVEQGFTAIRGTVKEQITLRDPSISLSDVRKAMKDTFLDDYVMKEIKGGYDAPYREEDFSRGQIQLLGLARALVTNPSLLLLDEISANLDSKTEKEVVEVLSNATSSRTVVSISHRLSDQLGFNRVIKVENGHVVG
ncbi:MAG: ABC transporter ATP-binding protein [Bacilli bacterium]